MKAWAKQKAKGGKEEKEKPGTQRRPKRRESGKENQAGSADLPRPWLHTYWLKRTRERTMNLKMYSKAFMAL